MNKNKESQNFLNIPHPELPVLFISAAGDQEGKSSVTIGFFNGEVEDILREVAPRANRKEPSYKADYEVDVTYYPVGQTQEIQKTIELWRGYTDTEVKYISSSSTKPANALSVLVHMWQARNKDAISGFLKCLKPGTRYDRKERFFHPHDEFINIQKKLY